LPTVVGEAGWPWVRDSIGRSASSCARSVRRAMSFSSAGSSTASRAPFSIRACDRLLMSSEVQAKWMNSDTAAISALDWVFSLRKYSTAFTS
jgi:hypothetical protein